MPRLLADLTTFMNLEESPLPDLIRAGMAHVQFESIHPFLDGNGRIGRLLVTLFLCQQKALQEPLLYLSLYLKRNREEYYRRLQAVRRQNDWLGWLQFFLTGVEQTATQAHQSAQSILALFRRDQDRLKEARAASSVMRVHGVLQQRPLLNVRTIEHQADISGPTANEAVAKLVEFGIVREITGRKRDRLFGYTEYLALLEEGTTPL